ncbi:MAG: hypothetical protein EXQ70_11475 [Solirubrobacterales bacterium]|nr:hypothetical protein [Solirubrobacterales bacterium]
MNWLKTRLRRRKKRPARSHAIEDARYAKPGDPVWDGIARMNNERRRAMRHSIDTGEPYRDPFFPKRG